MITVVGLGPGLKKYLSIEAYEKIKNAERLYARTEQHDCVKALREEGFDIKSFDYVYDDKDSFEEVYDFIVGELIKNNEKADVCYLVPGNPMVFEKTTALLIEKMGESELEIVHGSSFLDMVFTKTGLDPLKRLIVMDALDMVEELSFKTGYIVIAQCYDRMIASSVKLILGNYIDDEKEILLLNSLGTEREEIIKLPLYMLDRSKKLSHESSIMIEL